MIRTKVTLAVAVLVSLLVTGAAIAHGKRDRSHTDVALATFTVNQVKVTEKTCTGTDGEYRQFHAVYKGTSTGDARLTGNVVVRSHGVINQTTGFGQSKGTVAVKDATTGKWKAVGRYSAVNTDRGVLHGFINGHVKDRGTSTVEEQSGSGHLSANFKATFNAAGTTLTGQLGGTSADARTPAIIQSAGCGHRAKVHGKRGAEKKSDRKKH